jgi:hypothetical protein
MYARQSDGASSCRAHERVVMGGCWAVTAAHGLGWQGSSRLFAAIRNGLARLSLGRGAGPKGQQRKLGSQEGLERSRVREKRDGWAGWTR